jgi:hypothetical protein
MSKVADSIPPGASIWFGDHASYATRIRFFNEIKVNVIRSGEPVPGPPHPFSGQTGRELGEKEPTGGLAGLMDAASNDGRRSCATTGMQTRSSRPHVRDLMTFSFEDLAESLADRRHR